MKTIQYFIHSPVSAMSHDGRLFFNLSESILRKAMRENAQIEIQPGRFVDPRKWVRTGSRIEKYFKKPYPMILFGNYVEETKPKSQSLF